MAPQTPANSFTLPLILRGAGAGIYNLFRQLGKFFGVAFIVTLVDQREHYHYARLVAHLNPYSAAVQQYILQMEFALKLPLTIPHLGSPAAPAQVAPYQMFARIVQQQAAVKTYIDIFYLLIIIAIAALGLLFFFKKEKVQQALAH